MEAYREAFADRSCFLAAQGNGHYYFGDERAPAKAAVQTLDPGNPDDKWFFQELATVDDFALHVDANATLKLAKVWINVVVKDQGRKTGMTGTGLDLSAFMRSLVKGDDRSAQTILVDAKGTLQAHPNVAYMEGNANAKDESARKTLYQLLGSEGDRTLLRERLGRLAGGSSPLEDFSLTVEGRRYLVSAVPIPDIGWVALTLVDPAQVIGMRSFMPILAVLALSLLVILSLVSWILNRHVLGPLERLTGSAMEMAAGNYRVSLPVARGDEIGRLTEAFNHMAATVHEATENLERLVAERTQDLSQANRKLTDSLEYASLIQASTLPKAAALDAAMPERFVLFRPRDIVGGDFYAVIPAPGGFLLAVGDCTGHGVPGAFMSMCAGAILNQLVAKLGPNDPAHLLREMNHALKALLHQEEAEPRRRAMDNGLDLALLRVRAGHATFAGARIPLWTLAPADPEIQVAPGDPHSLGYRRSREDFAFENREVALPPGTLCFLFTDGILDQHGGRFNFGFGRRRLALALQSRRELAPAALGEALAQALAEYQGDNPQRDDITFIAFKAGAGNHP
jgi:serine phosphatase RsbU (regulator of sigma subunit)